MGTTFLTILAAAALPVSSFLLGAFLTGLRDGPATPDERPTTASQGWTLARLLIVIVGTAFILVEPAVIAPLPLQYLLLIVLPLALGCFARGLVGRWMASRR